MELKAKKNLSGAVSFLLLKLFSIEELVTSSVMGVPTKKGTWPGLDNEKRTLIESKWH